MHSPDPLAPLRIFRDARHAYFDRRADALFELANALLAAAPVASLPHLRLTPPHRRGRGSVYAALADGRSEAGALRAAAAAHRLIDGHPIYAVDVSESPRSDAEASPERRYGHPRATRRANRP